ncbi:carboxypeptidase-like regulatory domain-containing protein [Microbulbifer magnicolonia]|uniref:carboxypeptidase-like regulatory domain-containing protein n=1 Tax=Microbulbifer magnicolonia TaxID=3109744 RepID=UPI002B40AC1F|nr:carboxypeptidase-like regulatory domain-containing protein [Microbulbifer sp. GG15]
MSRQLRQVSWLALSANLIGFPLVTHAAEAPGALTFIVKDQNTDRPISTVQITIEERETNSTRSVETDAQGRIVVEQLDPGLYSVSVAKSGFASSYQPSVRVVTRKNIKIEFELGQQALEEVSVLGQQAEALSVNSTYLDREALRSAVGGGADPLLSLDGLPGLASASEFASFSVRGRGPRDNLLFVDDFPFDKAVHFDATLGEEEDVGGGGRFSIFAPNVISGAEFSPGGWSAAYGAGRHRCSNWKWPMAIQALQRVSVTTLRAMKLVTTALPVSLKVLRCSFLPGDWISVLCLKRSKSSILGSPS